MSAITQIRSFLVAHPLVVKFLRDAVEASVAAVGALVLTLPANMADAQKEAVVIAVAIGAAVIAVARRELAPMVLAYLGFAPQPAEDVSAN